MRFWYLSHIRAVEALVSLRISEASSEPSPLGHTEYGLKP